MSSNPVCFWSYAHRDNELEGGRIRRLAAAITNEYELLTGESLDLFLDSSDIHWGDKWRDVIDDALARTAFFIPIVTPNYLRSVECRREFVEFSSRAKRIDAMDLLLPILYSDTPAVADESTVDEIVVLVRATQRADWRKLRLAEESSESYRTAVHNLAKRLVEVLAAESARPLPSPPDDPQELDEPGFLEDVAAAEENIESWQGIFEEFVAQVLDVRIMVQDVNGRMEGLTNVRTAARDRLVLIRQFAESFAGPARRIDELGHDFFHSVVAADPGVRGLIEQGRSGSLAEGAQGEANGFFGTVRKLAESTEFISGEASDFIEQVKKGESLSRTLRKPLNELRGGFKAVMDAHTVIADWARLTQPDDADDED